MTSQVSLNPPPPHLVYVWEFRFLNMGVSIVFAVYHLQIKQGCRVMNSESPDQTEQSLDACH